MSQYLLKYLEVHPIQVRHILRYLTGVPTGNPFQLTLNFSGIKATLLRLLILSSDHAFTAQTGRSMFRRFSKQAGWISFLEQCACGKNDAGSSIQNFNF